MPHYRQLETRVRDMDGHHFPEYGMQILPSLKKVSVYVECETDKQFTVTVKPDHPFLSEDTAQAHGFATRKRLGADLRPGYVDSSASIKDQTKSKDEHQHFLNCKSLLLGDRNDQPERPPPFHLLMAVYLDGRDTPDRRAIVFLDPSDEHYNLNGNGEIEIRGRYFRNENGDLARVGFVFKEVGIETMFDKLLLGSAEIGDAEKAILEEGKLANLLASTHLDDQASKRPETQIRPGRIVVTLQRINLRKKRDECDIAKIPVQDRKDGDTKMADIPSSISHTLGYANVEVLDKKPKRMVAWEDYNPEEDFYATFTFFYRSKEQIAKFNFSSVRSTLTSRRLQRKKPFAGLPHLAESTSLVAGPDSLKRGSEDAESERAVRRVLKDQDKGPPYAFAPGYRGAENTVIEGDVDDTDSDDDVSSPVITRTSHLRSPNVADHSYNLRMPAVMYRLGSHKVTHPEPRARGNAVDEPIHQEQLIDDLSSITEGVSIMTHSRGACAKGASPTGTMMGKYEVSAGPPSSIEEEVLVKHKVEDDDDDNELKTELSDSADEDGNHRDRRRK